MDGPSDSAPEGGSAPPQGIKQQKFYYITEEELARIQNRDLADHITKRQEQYNPRVILQDLMQRHPEVVAGGAPGVFSNSIPPPPAGVGLPSTASLHTTPLFPAPTTSTCSSGTTEPPSGVFLGTTTGGMLTFHPDLGIIEQKVDDPFLKLEANAEICGNGNGLYNHQGGNISGLYSCGSNSETPARRPEDCGTPGYYGVDGSPALDFSDPCSPERIAPPRNSRNAASPFKVGISSNYAVQFGQQLQQKLDDLPPCHLQLSAEEYTALLQVLSNDALIQRHTVLSSLRRTLSSNSAATGGVASDVGGVSGCGIDSSPSRIGFEQSGGGSSRARASPPVRASGVFQGQLTPLNSSSSAEEQMYLGGYHGRSAATQRKSSSGGGSGSSGPDRPVGSNGSAASTVSGSSAGVHPKYDGGPTVPALGQTTMTAFMSAGAGGRTGAQMSLSGAGVTGSVASTASVANTNSAASPLGRAISSEAPAQNGTAGTGSKTGNCEQAANSGAARPQPTAALVRGGGPTPAQVGQGSSPAASRGAPASRDVPQTGAVGPATRKMNAAPPGTTSDHASGASGQRQQRGTHAPLVELRTPGMAQTTRRTSAAPTNSPESESPGQETPGKLDSLDQVDAELRLRTQGSVGDACSDIFSPGARIKSGLRPPASSVVEVSPTHAKMVQWSSMNCPDPKLVSVLSHLDCGLQPLGDIAPCSTEVTSPADPEQLGGRHGSFHNTTHQSHKPLGLIRPSEQIIPEE